MKRGGLDCVAGQNTQGVKQNKSQKKFIVKSKSQNTFFFQLTSFTLKSKIIVQES